MTYDEARNRIAVEYGFSDWGQVMRICDWEESEGYTNEAAELYARYKANDAVKEDRKDVVLIGDHHNLDIASLVNNRPLPFPDEP